MIKKDILNALRIIGKAFSLWWSDWVNQVLVSIIAVLFSLTIILFPAALMGVFYETKDLINGNRSGFLGFWKGFKKYFLFSLFWGFVNLLATIILIVNIWFYANVKTNWTPYLSILFIFFAVFWYILQFLSLGFVLEQEKISLKLAWSYGLYTISHSLLFSITISIVVLFISILSLGTFLPLIIGTPSLLTLLSILSVQDRKALFNFRNQ
jgi:hypothetical protein